VCPFVSVAHTISTTNSAPFTLNGHSVIGAHCSLSSRNTGINERVNYCNSTGVCPGNTGRVNSLGKSHSCHTPNIDDETHCAEVTNSLKMNLDIQKQGRLSFKQTKSSTKQSRIRNRYSSGSYNSTPYQHELEQGSQNKAASHIVPKRITVYNGLVRRSVLFSYLYYQNVFLLNLFPYQVIFDFNVFRTIICHLKH